LLAKYKGLVFCDPISEKSFLIWEQIWSSAGGEVMDGSWLLFVLMMMMTK
jgi:hypothetical protein